MICRDCQNEFKEKKIKKGYSNRCDDCSLDFDDQPKYLGYNDGSLNKSTHTSIYRGDSIEIRKKISKQNHRVC